MPDAVIVRVVVNRLDLGHFLATACLVNKKLVNIVRTNEVLGVTAVYVTV